MNVLARRRWMVAAASLTLALLTACTAPDPVSSSSSSPTGGSSDADGAESTSSAPTTAEPSESTSDGPAGSDGTTSPPPSAPPVDSESGAPPSPEESSPGTGTSSPPPSAPAEGASPGGPRASATPVVTYAEVTAGTLTVNAHVSVIEIGGTCTLRAVRGTDEVSTTVASFADATTTLCDPFEIALPGAGGWTVDLTYSSPRSEGSTTFEVTS